MPEKYQNKIKKSPKAPRGRIKAGVDNYKDRPEDSTRFTIGYEFYRHDLCEVANLLQGPLRKTIDNYKKFCTCTNNFELRQLSIHIDDVENANDYSKFFKGLSDDVEMKEFYTGDSGRAIFFIDPMTKVIQVVAHLNTHTETKKNRR